MVLTAEPDNKGPFIKISDPSAEIFYTIMKKLVLLSVVVLGIIFGAKSAHAQDFTPREYDMGSPVLSEIYVDPVNGRDSNSGASRAQALRTVDAAWRSIPESATLSTGYRINLLPGSYSAEDLPNYWELRRGTFEHPIIVRPADGRESVLWTAGVNMASSSYVYFIDLRMFPNPAADVFHCEACDHILLRGNRMNGAALGYGGGEDTAHETVKFNQSQYVYLENNNFSGADDNTIDFVSVQYGHVVGNKIHQAGDWCMYAKGGSAYLRIESNEIYDCGTGGFTAGQGTGFQYMTSPWLHYEAYDLKIANNIIHDTEGAALGVNGGYNILFAYNTAYRIGTRSHVFEAVFGARSCDPGDGVERCATYRNAGGWGPASVSSDDNDIAPIGNRNVFVLNNIFYNPAGTQSGFQHFAIYGPRTPPGGTNLSSPQRSDDNLVIKGNVVWNGDMSMPLGIEDTDQGCQNSNSTCNAAQLSADNSINTIEPQFASAEANDFRPTVSSNLLSAPTFALTDFAGGDRPSTPQAPQGNLENEVARDFSADVRASLQPPGAYASINSSLAPPDIDGSNGPGDGTMEMAPVVSAVTTQISRKGRVVTVKVSAKASQSPTEVVATLTARTLSAEKQLTRKGNKYAGKVRLRAKQHKFRLMITATNGAGSGAKGKTVKE